MAGQFDPGKHPRGAGGRFGTKPDSDTVGAQRLKSSGVGGTDLIKVLSSRVKKYAGFATVGDFLKAHPKGRAYALRVMAADHKAGRIAFADKPQARTEKPPKAPRKPAADGQNDVGQLSTAYVAVTRNGQQIRVEHGGKVQLEDHIVGRTEKTKARYGNSTVADFIANHPRGKDAALRTLASDIGKGHVSFSRVEVLERPKEIAFGSGVSDAFVERVNRGWAAIPPGIKTIIAKHGATIHAPDKLIDVAPDLAEVQPRGWKPGSTWKEVGGLFRSDTKQVVVAETSLKPEFGKYLPEHRGDSVLCHEMGHALDHALGRLSQSQPFRDAYEMDVKAYRRDGLSLDDERYKYFLQTENNFEGGRSEMFAEMHADRLGFPSNARVPPLGERFPECAKFMDKIIKATA